MRLSLPIAVAILFAGPAAATTPQWGPPIIIHLDNFHFTPRQIVLEHGQHYVLTLVSDGGAHSFFAPSFFAGAGLLPNERALAGPRGVEVPPRGAITLNVTAPGRPGRYKFKCTHSLHNMFGMNGEIVVR